MKKLIAMLLCVALMLSLSTMAFAAKAPEIRVEAEKPSAKTVDTKFNPYSWDATGATGVDHTKRVLDADGLEYTSAEKNVINIAYKDSYTYTFDAAAAGTYELHIKADCDRDIKVTYAINGGANADGNFMGHTGGAGAGYGGIEDFKLGDVELVKGSNTLTVTLIKNEANVNLFTDAFVFVPADDVVIEDENDDNNNGGDVDEILKGTPTVDGKLDDMYKKSMSIVQGKTPDVINANANDTDNVEATIYFLHDGEWLYICAVVTGDTEIIDTEKSWPLDGVDVWFLTPNAPTDATRSKITMEAHASPSSEFVNDRENELGVDMSKVVNAATRDQANNTYTVEAKLPIPYASKSEGTIAINTQLNNAYSDGSKFGSYGAQYTIAPTILALSDTSAETPSKPDVNPGTGDMAIAGLVVAMMAATAGVVVMKKKEF